MITIKTIGIICEYNPFHNGHIYHLAKIKEMYPNSLIILVLNGYFCERGDVTIISKQDKVRLSLLNGIDIVIELPFVYGSQSADIFANASIKYLEYLKCDYVIFGSECNDIKKLNEVTDYILNNKDYDKLVQEYLKKGYNYPTSLAKAINVDFAFLPNDLLGLSYLKSIKENHYQIKALTIKRTNNYLDTKSDNTIISATNIRQKLREQKDIAKYVPSTTLPYIQNINQDMLFNLIKYKIITSHNLSIYLDVDEGINYRIKKVINQVSNLDELIKQIKSKRYTYNKIKRMLMHILVGLTKEDNTKLKIEYLKILGFNDLGKNYLHNINKKLDIPTKIDKNSLVNQYELKCAIIYDLITNNTSNFEFERQNKPIKIEKEV